MMSAKGDIVVLENWTILSALELLIPLARCEVLAVWDEVLSWREQEQLRSRLVALQDEEIADLFRWSRQPAFFLGALRRLWVSESVQCRIEKISALCKEEMRVALIQTMLREHVTGQIFARLASCGVSFAPFKGEYLTHLLEMPYASRPSSDLDLLIQPGQLDQAIEALVGLGCRPISDDPVVIEYMKEKKHEFQMIHPQIGLIELHSRLFEDLPVDWIEEVWQRASHSSYLGCEVFCIDPSDMYVILCVHLFQHGWHQCPKWLIDLLYFHEAFKRPGKQVGGRYVEGVERRKANELAKMSGSSFRLCVIEHVIGVLLSRGAVSPSTCLLEASLCEREVHALKIIRRTPLLLLYTDWLVFQARCARENDPLRSSLWATLWPHRGRVAKEMHVRSDASLFFFVRLLWFACRLLRGFKMLFHRSTSGCKAHCDQRPHFSTLSASSLSR